MERKTLIVSAFPGCGKTYCVENPPILKIDGEEITLLCKDSDSSKYPKTEDRYKKYVDDIEKDIGEYHIIFISQQDELREELNKRGIPFIAVGPWQSDELTDKDKQDIKDEWFHRFCCRDNSHIQDFKDWTRRIHDNWDEWTSFEHYASYGAKRVLQLDSYQYLSHVIGAIYSLVDCEDFFASKGNTYIDDFF